MYDCVIARRDALENTSTSYRGKSAQRGFHEKIGILSVGRGVSRQSGIGVIAALFRNAGSAAGRSERSHGGHDHLQMLGHLMHNGLEAERRGHRFRLPRTL